MALKLIGAVGIKVRPEAEDFRDDAERQLKKQLKDGFDAPMRLNPEMDDKKLQQDFEKHKKKLQKQLDSMSKGLSFKPPR